ncbi:uncharacterized protein [Choristoneura fumiferana]|uniref:uncharacterized protein n=1 Tax=Choristoneura fumiferana TaxID=7141 RepID=UPI003D15D5DB
MRRVGGSEEIGCDILIDSTALPKVSRFKYLESMLTTDAHIEEDVNHRVNTAWLKWRSLSDVLCDNKMPMKTKGKIYKTAVRPAMTYESECWTTLKKHEEKLPTAEMKMLHWAGGVTRLDKVRNEYVRGSFKVAPVAEKLKASRLRWDLKAQEYLTNDNPGQSVLAPTYKEARPQLKWEGGKKKKMV